ncbi:hypothetical protein pEaSNUABM56_00268 [Erwinia phage pEa_SNUABM_56]|uniref:Uncharacterized protein n=1 Tax=Erwinia phage pEp_SNUABM_01 TaxID=2601643 RepID=A0A5J6DBJ2_9CAUD|nr:hypothetical protein HWC63_gp135 [Erwinia phage pEp_SNUABM_01]QEQ95043.1 hypothetical protein pEpSNUABM01_217 [Erwinia phage pEp_SNUABM_01]UYL85288.1 hypothetical protein pEaSNUABM56_00268 [Erwinia phage pEa_SNUABM_56]
MKATIYKLSKTNLIGACLLACVVGMITNTVFNGVGGLAFDADNVNITNNVIDALQLALYVLVKLSTVGKLNRYDLPPVLGGLTSLIM